MHPLVVGSVCSFIYHSVVLVIKVDFPYGKIRIFEIFSSADQNSEPARTTGNRNIHLADTSFSITSSALSKPAVRRQFNLFYSFGQKLPPNPERITCRTEKNTSIVCHIKWSWLLFKIFLRGLAVLTLSSRHYISHACCLHFLNQMLLPSILSENIPRGIQLLL